MPFNTHTRKERYSSEGLPGNQALPHDGMREPELSHGDLREAGGKSEHGTCTVHPVPGVCCE